ncbi:MAG: RagB/SusD family nutrient uptake outer membrane protein [Bacteroidota bacterium]|nr:RagB/SusD family nutrient uptake outer membrane protein [Bacteroidota bacterium]
MRKTIIPVVSMLSMLILFALNSCKDFLTEEPLSQITEDQFFQTRDDIASAMAGLYSSFRIEMTGAGTGSTQGKYHYWGEVRSDNFDKSQYGGTSQNEMALNSMTAGNNFCDWTGLYRTISRANVNLQGIPKVKYLDNKVTADTVSKYMAQCYAMRAMCYFYIVRLWGDAPVWTAPYEDVTKSALKARTPKDSILNYIILPDLTNAYSMIKKNQNTNVWYISESAICATLADVYMWMHDYDNALIWFGKLFATKTPTGTTYGTPVANDSSRIEKASTWKNVFLAPGSSLEGIWSIYFDNPTSDNSPNLAPSTGISNSGLKPDSAVFNGTPSIGWTGSVDRRARQTIDILQTGWGNLLKFYPAGTKTSLADTKALPAYLTMYRLSDMYLLYAEALNQKGNYQAAIDIVNLMRFRARVPVCKSVATWTIPSSTTTQQAVEDTVLTERRWELYGEGKRWFDLVRTYHTNKVMQPVIKRRLRVYYGSSFDPNALFECYLQENKATGTFDPREYFPIDRGVLDANKLLIQNNPY